MKPKNKCIECITKLFIEMAQLNTSKKDIANKIKTIIQIILSPFRLLKKTINYKLNTHSLNILPRSW